jgi:hypothetical protein
MLGIREVSNRAWRPVGDPNRHGSGQDGQEKWPRWTGPLMFLGLLLLVGLFVFVHGCGQHDHDDELSLPLTELPAGQH